MDQAFRSRAAATLRLTRMRRALVSLTLLVAATAGLTTWAQGRSADAPASGHAAHGMEAHGMGEHGKREHGKSGHGKPEHMLRHMDRMLDGLNVTEAQRSQIRQIAQAAMADLAAQRKAGRAMHDQGWALFTAAQVDPVVVEQARLQKMAQHDQMTRRMTRAMLDISQVLTPEQRAQLGARLKDRANMMKERRQRMHGQHHRSDAPAQ